MDILLRIHIPQTVSYIPSSKDYCKIGVGMWTLSSFKFNSSPSLLLLFSLQTILHFSNTASPKLENAFSPLQWKRLNTISLVTWFVSQFQIIQNIKAIMLHPESLPQEKSAVSKLNPFVRIYAAFLWRTSISVLSGRVLSPRLNHLKPVT